MRPSRACSIAIWLLLALAPTLLFRRVARLGGNGQNGRAIGGRNSRAIGGTPCGALHTKVSLAGGEKKTITYVLAGTGLATLASFTYFALRGRAQESDLESRCAPNCGRDEADAMQSKYLAADVSLGLAAVSLGAATYVYLSRPAVSADTTATRILPLRNGVQLEFHGRF